MKKTFLFSVLLLMSIGAFAQNQNFAVGARLGEPAGLNIRKYLRDELRSIEINIGTYGGFWGNHRKYGKEGHYRNVGLSINAIMLWHHDLFGKENFKSYYGFGGQINNRRSFPDRLAGNYERVVSLGGVGQAGVEYFVTDQPFSVFAEAGLYAEVLPVPFFLHPQGGLGVRFNF
jgi:hypothetical protein